MAEELGTRDVVEQLDARLGNLEQAQRDLRSEMATRFAQVDSRLDGLGSEMNHLRTDMNTRFGQVDSRLDQMRTDMDNRFGRVTALLVTVVLALVVGVGGLWVR